MAVSTFVNATVSYVASAPCTASCEAECVRRPDCAGFSTTELYVGTGGLVSGYVNARCGPSARPCPTTQIVFQLEDDGMQCAHAGVPVFVADGVSITASQRNCSISTTVRATEFGGYFSIPRLDTHGGKGSTERIAIAAAVVGALLAAAMGGFVAWHYRH